MTVDLYILRGLKKIGHTVGLGSGVQRSGFWVVRSRFCVPSTDSALALKPFNPEPLNLSTLNLDRKSL